jgi:hypothetical protein
VQYFQSKGIASLSVRRLPRLDVNEAAIDSGPLYFARASRKTSWTRSLTERGFKISPGKPDATRETTQNQCTPMGCRYCAAQNLRPIITWTGVWRGEDCNVRGLGYIGVW